LSLNPLESSNPNEPSFLKLIRKTSKELVSYFRVDSSAEDLVQYSVAKSKSLTRILKEQTHPVFPFPYQPLEIIYHSIVNSFMNFTIEDIYSEHSWVLHRCGIFQAHNAFDHHCGIIEESSTNLNGSAPSKWILDEGPKYWLPTHEISYIFITCSSLEKKNKFTAYAESYTNPFDSVKWSLIISSTFAFAAIICVLLFKYNPRRQRFSNYFWFQLPNVVVATCGCILDISFRYTDLLRKRSGRYSILLYIWFLCCIVISSSYRSIMTRRLTAPYENDSPKTWRDLLERAVHIKLISFDVLPSKNQEMWHVYALFQDLAKLRIVTSVFEDDVLHSLFGTEQRVLNKDCLKTGPSWLPDCPQDNSSSTSLALKAVYRTQAFADGSNNSKTTKDSTSPLTYKYDKVESQISDCDGTAFVDFTSNYENYLRYAFPKRSSVKRYLYTKSTDSFLNSQRFIRFSRHTNPFLVQRISNAIEAGLYAYWREQKAFYDIIRSLRMFAGDIEAEAVPLESDILVLFIVWAVGTVCSFIFFIVEYLELNINWKLYLQEIQHWKENITKSMHVLRTFLLTIPQKGIAYAVHECM
jgi:hypothetical protein